MCVNKYFNFIIFCNRSIKEECDDDEYKTVSNFQIQNYFTESNSDDTSSVIK